MSWGSRSTIQAVRPDYEWRRLGGKTVAAEPDSGRDCLQRPHRHRLHPHSAQGWLSVPEDVQVIGFDNILDASLLEPRLTTIASPVVSLGSAAVNLLLRTARHEGSHAAKRAFLPARLIIRDTTQPGTSSLASPG